MPSRLMALVNIGHSIEPVTPDTDITWYLRTWVCATCYGDLTHLVDRETEVDAILCPDQNCSGMGFAKRTWTIQRVARSRMELTNARHDLRESPWGKAHPEAIAKRETESDLLKGLGF